MSIKIYKSLGPSSTEREFGSPCLVCEKPFSIGEVYFIASNNSYIPNMTFISFGRVHVDCVKVGQLKWNVVEKGGRHD